MAMHHFKSPAVLTECEQRVNKAAVYDTTNYPDKLEQKKLNCLVASYTGFNITIVFLIFNNSEFIDSIVRLLLNFSVSGPAGDCFTFSFVNFSYFLSVITANKSTKRQLLAFGFNLKRFISGV